MTSNPQDDFVRALDVGAIIYGGIMSHYGDQMSKCLQVVKTLGDAARSPISIGRYNNAQKAFEQQAEFNRKYPITTKGTVTLENGTKITTCVDAAAMVYPDSVGGEKVMAWFGNVGWRDISAFTVEESKVTTSQELTQLGQQSRARGNNDMAERLYAAAIQADDKNFHAMNELGVLYAGDQNYEFALAYYTAALDVEPHSAQVLNNRGNLYRAIGRPEEAMADFEEALRWLPGNELISLNAASVMDDVGRTDDCLKVIDEHLFRNPGKVTVQYNRALVLLGAGRFVEGWKAYDSRLWQQTANSHYEHFNIPRWDGSDLSGKTVLIWGEQGLGDEILTASMIRDVLDRGAQVTLLCSRRLEHLFIRSFPGVTIGIRSEAGLGDMFQRVPLKPQWLPKAVRDGQFDFQMSQGDLGAAFRPSLESFPRRTFLSADQEKSADLRRACKSLCGDNTNLLVGITWNSARNLRIGKLKSIDILALAPILKTPGATFVNLQYGDCSEDLAKVQEQLGVKIINLPEINPLLNMDSYASLVAAMDLVITVSNTTAHVAGGLGIPTWVLTPEGPGRLWYWFRDIEYSPWYEKVHLFRQKATTQWESAISNVAHSLEVTCTR